jgi:hypothetical protein
MANHDASAVHVADSVREVRGRRKTLLFIGTYFRSSESLQGPSRGRGARVDSS